MKLNVFRLMTLMLCFVALTIGDVSAQTFGQPNVGATVQTDAEYDAIAQKVKVEYVVAKQQASNFTEGTSQYDEASAKMFMYESVLENLRAGATLYDSAAGAYKSFARLVGRTPNLADQEFTDLYFLINS